jgi:Na+-transporting methylmalonyl-CoA/oxaloacetate decarboxylase gamma subunit
MFSKGLLVTAIGLAGVFLVLGLFFVTIKLLQKIGNDNEN